MRIGLRRWLSGLLILGIVGPSCLAGGGTAQAENHGEEPNETVVVFQIDSTTYTVDGVVYQMDVAPRIDWHSGRTLLPVRYASEAMNASVHWNAEGERIAIVHNETARILDIAVGEDSLRVTDSEEEYSDSQLDQAPVIDPPGRTMLPIRAVAESLYGKVSYDERTRRITIVRPANQPETLEPAPTQLNFGEVLPHSHKEMESHPENVRPLTISNKGEGPLFVDAVSFREGGIFSLCGKQFEPFELAPGESRRILVCADAERPGEYVDDLIFKSRVRIDTDLLIKPIRLWVYILGCRVNIIGGGQRPNINTSGNAPLGAAGVDAPVVNVGQEIALQAAVSGLFAPYTYQWSVNGNHIKTYQEKTTAAWSTTAMSPADYKSANVGYYWNQTGVHAVTIKVTNALGFSCSRTRYFTVERNSTDSNRQAEDFYTWNHTSAVLNEHYNWHVANPYNPCTQVGTPFHTFHRAFLSRFNSWRSEFGYAALSQWDPGTPLPGGIANAHASRGPSFNPLANKVPTYLTTVGGALASGCFAAKKKADFPSTNGFWIEAEGPWHNGVHVAIGGATGDMRFVNRAPKDPIFWRFHLYVDGL